MEETEVKGKDEKLSAYEVVLVTADKKDVEVRVSPDGKILEDTGAKNQRKEVRRLARLSLQPALPLNQRLFGEGGFSWLPASQLSTMPPRWEISRPSRR